MSSLITNFTYAETIRNENVVSSSTINNQVDNFVIDEGNIDVLKNDYYNAGTVKIKRNLDAKTYEKQQDSACFFIDKEDFDKAVKYLEDKLKLTKNQLHYDNTPKIYYDKNLGKFYKDFTFSDKKYKLFFAGSNDEYLFADDSDNKLNPNDKEDLISILSFIENEYKNIKKIELQNENIVTNDENQKELIVKITDENNNLRTAKIILTPSKISEHYNYSYQNNKQKNLDFLNIDVSFTEKKNELLTDETINRINEKINNKINNNPLYNENFILNDKNIYKYNNYQYIRFYNKNDGKYLYVKISNTKPDFEINLTEDEPDEEDLNFLKSLKISEYNCYIDEISKYYTSKQGNLSVLDFVNSKLNENEYIDNFEQKNEYTEKENLNLFIFHIKNKTNNTTRYITINLSTPNIIDSVYLDNFNANLILTDKNKEDLKTIIKRYAKRNYKKIDIDDQLKKDENRQFYANVTIYFDDDVYIKKEIEIVKSDVYYMGLPSPACPPETRSSIIDYPKYPEECQRTFRVIINPSLKTTYNLISCPNKPEKPNEIPKNEKPPVVITPSNLPKESPSELPKENEPKQSTPNKTIPNRNATSKPTEKTPNEVVEKTPITIISNEKKQSVNGESREIENTIGLQNIQRKEIKTGDNLFNIIYLIGTFGIFAYFINLLKNKYKHKLN